MAIAAYNSSVLVTAQPSIATTNEATSTSDLTTYTISTAAHRYFDPTVAVGVQTSPDGTTWATVTTGFTLRRCNARVVFAVAQPSGTQVRFSTASYFAYATMAEASSGDFSAKYTMDDVTVFNTSGTKSFLPTVLEGTFKTTTFWISQVRATSLLARDLLVVSFVLSSGNRYEGFCYASDLDLKYDPKKAVNQDLTFQLTNEFFNA